MKVMTLILAGGRGERLGPLTLHRTKPAVPFGGVYRIIDFTLSNCIHSNLRQIFVLTQYKSDSLSRHLVSGWSFLPGGLGEFITIVPPQQRVGERWYEGTADAVFQNLHLLRDHKPELVLVLAGDHIYKMDYKEMLDFHERARADVTVAAIEMETEKAAGLGILEYDGENRVLGFEEKPVKPREIPGRPGFAAVSMGIYVFKPDVLAERVSWDTRPGAQHDFGKHVIPGLIGESRVLAYEFKDRNKREVKYWRDVGTVDTYYEANMDLVGVSPHLNLYDNEWPILTTRPPLPPPKFVFAQEGEGARRGLALDSLVAPGCIVSGGKVQNAVLGYQVRINSYCEVAESILSDGVEIGRYAKVRRAILDKEVKVAPGARIGYDPAEDGRRFFVSPGGIVVIPKGQAVEA